MPEAEPQNKPRPARDPQALTSEYHKARKQLMLWSAILFIWSLIGIDLEKAKEAGGNTGALIKSLKSPQAVPWALFIIVAYFSFKLRIEWRQCNEARRKVKEAKHDYYSACIVAGLAGLLYVGQTISQIQFADAIQNTTNTAVGVAYGIGGTLIVKHSLSMIRRKNRDLMDTAFSIMGVLTGVAMFAGSIIFRLPWRGVLTGTLVAGLLMLLRLLLRRYLKSRKPATGMSQA